MKKKVEKRKLKMRFALYREDIGWFLIYDGVEIAEIEHPILYKKLYYKEELTNEEKEQIKLIGKLHIIRPEHNSKSLFHIGSIIKEEINKIFCNKNE